MRTALVNVAVVATVAVLALACGGAPAAPVADAGDYVGRVTRSRAAKDADFASGGDSPIPPSRRTALLPLEYFPVDPAYTASAALKPSDDQTVYDMPTSSGQTRQETRAGTLEFTLKGQPMTLVAFVEAGSRNVGELFVPFGDLTNGVETYQAGRYLEVTRTAKDTYEIDFNMAFNPYCYYNLSYECPLPPRENRLTIAVEAGERIRKTGEGPQP